MTPDKPIKFHHLVNAAGLLNGTSDHARTIKAGIQQQHNTIAMRDEQILALKREHKIALDGLRKDVNGQRGEIERALAAMEDVRNIKFAQRILRGILEHHNDQREPRKVKP